MSSPRPGQMLSVTAGASPRPRPHQAGLPERRDLAPVAGVVTRRRSQHAAYSLMGEAQAGLAQIRLGEASQAANSVASTSPTSASTPPSSPASARARPCSPATPAPTSTASRSRRCCHRRDRAPRVDREGVLAQIAQLNRRAQEQGDQARHPREEAQIRDRARAGAQEAAELTERAHAVSRRPPSTTRRVRPARPGRGAPPRTPQRGDPTRSTQGPRHATRQDQGRDRGRAAASHRGLPHGGRRRRGRAASRVLRRVPRGALRTVRERIDRHRSRTSRPSRHFAALAGQARRAPVSARLGPAGARRRAASALLALRAIHPHARVPLRSPERPA